MEREIHEPFLKKAKELAELSYDARFNGSCTGNPEAAAESALDSYLEG